MRLVQVRFATREAFLKDYLRESTLGGVFVGTEDPYEVGEAVLVEISFPEIPEGVFIPGRIAWRRLPARWRSALAPGVGIEFAPGEAAKREFLVDFASGALDLVRKRQRRLPVRFPVDFVLVGGASRTRADARDLARGGLFLSTTLLARYGSMLDMSLYLPGGADPLEQRGRVAWIGRLGKETGMGVQFLLTTAEMRDRIDRLVRGIEDALQRGGGSGTDSAPHE